MGRMDQLIKRETPVADVVLHPYNPELITAVEIPTFVIVDEVPPEPMSWAELLQMFLMPEDLFQG